MGLRGHGVGVVTEGLVEGDVMLEAAGVEPLRDGKRVSLR